MDFSCLKKIGHWTWQLMPEDRMRVPAIFFASETLLAEMDQKVLEQLSNVATLPGIVAASMAMPDAHWGYGFPIGGVAAFDPDLGGVVSAGGVGFDIACGVRTLLTGIHFKELLPRKKVLADLLFQTIPAGLGSRGKLKVKNKEMDALLFHGAKWAVDQGFGDKNDLDKIEEKGTARGARPEFVSAKAKQRQEREMGTLGSGNHYLEVQIIEEIYHQKAARAFGLRPGDCVVTIHCGSRGLGHQIATEFMRLMVVEAQKQKIYLPDRDLACAPIHSETGQKYLGAMRAAINCALANRQILTHLVRQTFDAVFPGINMPLLYDVAHNTCREELHEIAGQKRKLFVHRKGATRAFGPGHPDLPLEYLEVGQPVLIGGSMGTSSYILVGTEKGMKLSFGSACHGAGRIMSRKQAKKRFTGPQIVQELLEHQGIEIRGHSFRGLAEEAPDAYKNIAEVVEVAHQAHLAYKVARLRPIICIKG